MLERLAAEKKKNQGRCVLLVVWNQRLSEGWGGERERSERLVWQMVRWSKLSLFSKIFYLVLAITLFIYNCSWICMHSMVNVWSLLIQAYCLYLLLEFSNIKSTPNYSLISRLNQPYENTFGLKVMGHAARDQKPLFTI